MSGEYDWPVRRILTKRRAAAYLGIGMNTLSRIPPTEIPFYRFGTRGDRRYSTIDLDAWLSARRVDGEEEGNA